MGTQCFSLGASKVSLRANIDQAFSGQLILSTVKAGSFFSGIGYLNEQHQHAWVCPLPENEIPFLIPFGWWLEGAS